MFRDGESSAATAVFPATLQQLRPPRPRVCSPGDPSLKAHHHSQAGVVSWSGVVRGGVTGWEDTEQGLQVVSEAA